MALTLCHNVTPAWDGVIRSLQASSPDEFALVSFAESLNYILQERDEYKISFKNSRNLI